MADANLKPFLIRIAVFTGLAVVFAFLAGFLLAVILTSGTAASTIPATQPPAAVGSRPAKAPEPVRPEPAQTAPQVATVGNSGGGQQISTAPNDATEPAAGPSGGATADPSGNSSSQPQGGSAAGDASAEGLSFASASGGSGDSDTSSTASQNGGTGDPLLQNAPPPAAASSNANGGGAATGNAPTATTPTDDGASGSTVSFAVQFGTFADQARASEMLTALQALGITSRIVVETDVNNQRWYAVRTPPFVDQAAAEHAALAIRDRHGLSSLVMAQPSGDLP